MQSVYAPLSQYFSDSDSEKEIIMEQVFTTNWNANNILTNMNTKNNAIPQDEYQMNNNINQPKIKTKRVRFAMSNSRKAAFVTSIVFCFLPVIVFLWVVPCNNSAICAVKVSNWKNAQHHMEFTGKINLIEGTFRDQNLALMYKGSFNDPKVLKNGVLAFSGRSGSVLWNFQQESCPLKMNCNMIDVNHDGFRDCLVLDETGLKAINTLSGELIWHFNSAEYSGNPEGSDFPVSMNDFDNDGIIDLILLSKKEILLLISGQTGDTLCRIKVSTCLFIQDLEAVPENIKFRCIFTNDTNVYYHISFYDINSKCKHLDKSIPLISVEQKNDTVDEYLYQSGKQKLTVHIYGQCPHCQSSVALFYNRDKVVKSWFYENAQVSAPIPFYLNYTGDSLVDNHINGFIFKVWQWKKDSGELSSSTQVHQRQLPEDYKNYHLYPVTESVVLLSFYENYTRNINVSMNEVYVICKGQNFNECQPNYEDRQYSLQIADLDRDNSLELISYYSSYQKEERNGIDNWNVMSKLTVFRLAEELPKLYKNKK